MEMDVRTLVFVVGLTHVIQLAVFIHQYLINKTIRGVVWWLLWSGAEVIGFAFMFLRGIPSIHLIAIIGQNALIVSGVFFLYIGIMRFFDKKENRTLSISIFTVFMASLLYFLFVNDNIHMRGAIISATLATVSFLSAQALWVNKTRAVSASAIFLSATFIAHGGYHAFRAAMILAGAPVDIFFAPTLINVTTYIDAIIAGNVWTFGFIIMINQHLNAEVTEAKEEIELIFNTSPDAVIITRLSDGLVVNVNEGFSALSGFSRDEAIGKTVFDINIWKNHDDRQKIVNDLRAKGFSDNSEAIFQRKDGGHFFGLMSAKMISLKDVPHIISVTRDITERKQAAEEKTDLENQTRKFQKAESLGRMAGAIAHHFNNQLQAVMGNLELAMEELPPGTGPVATMAEAMRAARRASEVSGLMLTYLGETRIKREPMDLAAACNRDLPMLRAAMPTNVVLEADLPCPGPVIGANANQIQQVLANLVTNAWEAMGDDPGILRLSVKTGSPRDIPALQRFPVGWQPLDQAYACLEVADKGCGIAEQYLENLFDPFFTTKFTGRGLGLPVVLGIVRAHGGVVTVESKPGWGSVFRVFLPVSAEEVYLQAEPPAPEIEANGTVLLVEDEENVRNITARMLQHLGFAVLEARDGIEAVEVFRRHKAEVRCVLCDLTMPRMNGWEILAALRALRPDLPVILASGYDKARAMAGDHPEWPQVFLGKPFARKELRDALNQALAGRR